MKTFTRVYDTYVQAEEAVRALESAGVPTADMSLVANNGMAERHPNVDHTSGAAAGAGLGAAVGAGWGAAVGGGVGLLTGLGLMAIPGLGPVVAAGWLAATALGAAAGSAAGGLIGSLVDSGVPESDAHVYSEVVRRGGTLLTVRTDANDAAVLRILDQYNPVDPTARRREYESAGWTRVDPDDGPLPSRGNDRTQFHDRLG